MDYCGKERQVVRSAALFTLGVFYIIIGLLPKILMKTASLFTGFPGDRDLGIDMLRKCWKEEGLLAPWAALSIMAYHLDLKTFLSEKLTNGEIDLVQSVMKWANEEYPKSLFFSSLCADAAAVIQRDPVYSLKLQNTRAEEMETLPALK